MNVVRPTELQIAIEKVAGFLPAETKQRLYKEGVAIMQQGHVVDDLKVNYVGGTHMKLIEKPVPPANVQRTGDVELPAVAEVKRKRGRPPKSKAEVPATVDQCPAESGTRIPEELPEPDFVTDQAVE